MVDFSKASLVVISSYPRSGNTLLRTILFQCFGLRSASAYPNDLGENVALENYVGHLRSDAEGDVEWPTGIRPRIFKRHDLIEYDGPTIYIVRNGRDAIKSLYRFYEGEKSMESVIKGDSGFGTWADHVRFWFAREQGQTLLLRYEQLVSDLPLALRLLASSLKRPIITPVLPNREEIVGSNKHWVRSLDDRPAPLSDEEERLFQHVNGDVMQKLGYN
jgi:hypothetical protein